MPPARFERTAPGLGKRTGATGDIMAGPIRSIPRATRRSLVIGDRVRFCQRGSKAVADGRAPLVRNCGENGENRRDGISSAPAPRTRRGHIAPLPNPATPQDWDSRSVSDREQSQRIGDACYRSATTVAVGRASSETEGTRRTCRRARRTNCYDCGASGTRFCPCGACRRFCNALCRELYRPYPPPFARGVPSPGTVQASPLCRYMPGCVGSWSR